MEALRLWLSEGGSVIENHVDFVENRSLGRCLAVDADCEAHTIVLNVSKSCLLNHVSCLRHLANWNEEIKRYLSSHGVKAYEKDGIKDDITEFYSEWSLEEIQQLNSTQLLTLYLTMEFSRPTSYWAPFLHWLPPLDDFNDLPLSWLNTAKQENWDLLPRWARKHVKSQSETFALDIETISKLLPDSGCSAQSIMRSWLCINTRCLYWNAPAFLKLQDITPNHVTLVPFIDFINHSNESNCEAKYTKSGFEIKAKRHIKKGEHLWFTYGAHDSLFLQCEYGFSISTPYDYVDITDYLAVLFKKRDAMKNWLEDNGYWGHFTIDNDGSIGYTTQVAIAALLEPLDQFHKSKAGIWKVPSRLRVFVSGESNGEEYQDGTNKIMKSISSKLTVELSKKEEHSTNNTVKKLNDYQLSILNKCVF